MPATPRSQKSWRFRRRKWKVTSSRRSRMGFSRPRSTNSRKPSSSSNFSLTQPSQIPRPTSWGQRLPAEEYINTRGQAGADRQRPVMYIFSRQLDKYNAIDAKILIRSAPLGIVMAAGWRNVDLRLDLPIPLSLSSQFCCVLFMFIGVFMWEVRVFTIVSAEAFLERLFSGLGKDWAVLETDALCDLASHIILLILAEDWRIWHSLPQTTSPHQQAVGLNNGAVLVDRLHHLLDRRIPFEYSLLFRVLWSKALYFLKVLLKIEFLFIVAVSRFSTRDVLSE